MLKPLGNRVLLQREEVKQASNIILLDAGTKSNEGIIVAKGPKSTLELGDKVLFAAYSGRELNLGGVDFVMVAEEDVLGVM